MASITHPLLHLLPKTSPQKCSPPSPLLLHSLTTTTSSLSPPTSQQEAISQAKSLLSSSLQKPLNTPPLLTRKLNNRPQPRFRIEIPVAAASPDISLSADLFSNLPITKKSSPPTILLLWPSLALAQSAPRQFTSSKYIIHSCVGDEISSFVDVAVFVAPEASSLEEVRVISNSLGSKPVVLFNPRWEFEEEKGFGGGLRRFVESFEVIYSFMGLEVRGLLSRRNGVLFRVVGGEGWVVMVEDDGKKEKEKKGELRVVSRFERRPDIGEVEDVLYNLMAANSPVARAIKYVRGLVGRKKIN